jgi:hypothetical protein
LTRSSLALATFATFAAGPAALSAAHHVPGEYAAINAALTASASGDTVLVSPGTYDEYEIRDLGSGGVASCAFLVGGVVLLSEGGAEVTTIEMQGAVAPWTYVVMAYYLAEEVTISGFTITESQSDGGKMYISSCAKVTIRDCIFRDMANDGSGGAVGAGYSDLEITGCQFTNCRADIGGGVWLYDGRILVQDCEFEGCEDRAIGLRGEQGFHPEGAGIERCRFVGCHSELNGGAIFTANTQELVTITECVFESNTAEMGGGAASLSGSQHRVEDCVFMGNWALDPSTKGGALKTYANTIVENSTFFGNGQVNSALGGAAIAFYDGVSELRNNIVVGSLGGPAIRVSSGSASVTSSCNVFWENEGGIGDGYTPGPTDREVNPLFCDPENGDLSLAENSPCLPPQSGACGLIGALGRGCGPISVESRSWGRIKDLYR